ncbi:hypothetical protein GCM10012284_33760 [Mangrovihabitans endophyticus]|uniref:Uncharacterized protein n=1 Tax=Mangrovihabitans endophyticus TaxID=1751298 RepID=A0A8J3BZL2_9ACTN|nr:hypothetical protein GCM10012284_33760 [Mangrovihabitans endophyticus]
MGRRTRIVERAGPRTRRTWVGVSYKRRPPSGGDEGRPGFGSGGVEPNRLGDRGGRNHRESGNANKLAELCRSRRSVTRDSDCNLPDRGWPDNNMPANNMNTCRNNSMPYTWPAVEYPL